MLAIRCEHLRRVYRQGRDDVEALRDVSLNVEAGEMVCVLGRSGSGKSTLLNVIGCLERPTSGRLFIGEDEASRMTERQRVAVRRSRIGFVFQSSNLLPTLTAIENVALPLRYAGLGRERIARARALLDRVGLEARADFLPQQLSGGEQQRVALARALASEPLIVLADEPTGELDSTTADEIATLFEQVNQSRHTTFLIVTHDERLARRAHRVVRMEDGRLEDASGIDLQPVN